MSVRSSRNISNPKTSSSRSNSEDQSAWIHSKRTSSKARRHNRSVSEKKRTLLVKIMPNWHCSSYNKRRSGKNLSSNSRKPSATRRRNSRKALNPSQIATHLRRHHSRGTKHSKRGTKTRLISLQLWRIQSSSCPSFNTKEPYWSKATKSPWKWRRWRINSNQRKYPVSM